MKVNDSFYEIGSSSPSRDINSPGKSSHFLHFFKNFFVKRVSFFPVLMKPSNAPRTTPRVRHVCFHAPSSSAKRYRWPGFFAPVARSWLRWGLTGVPVTCGLAMFRAQWWSSNSSAFRVLSTSVVCADLPRLLWLNLFIRALALKILVTAFWMFQPRTKLQFKIRWRFSNISCWFIALSLLGLPFYLA